MDSQDRYHWREIWAHALQLSGSRGKSQLAAWLLRGDSTAALLGDGVDPLYLQESDRQIVEDRRRKILNETF